MSAELSSQGIAVNALWPQTVIATKALNMFEHGEQLEKSSRSPEIMADAAYEILSRDARQTSGQFFIDETLLRQSGIKNFDHYAAFSGHALAKDFFLD